jgi:hypothetical protein
MPLWSSCNPGATPNSCILHDPHGKWNDEPLVAAHEPKREASRIVKLIGITTHWG